MQNRNVSRRARQMAVLAAAGSMTVVGTGVGAAAATSHKATGHRATSHAKSVTITFWDDNGGPRTPIYQHLIPIFERENPGIKVKYVGIPDTSVLEKYDAAIQGGSPPDIAAIPGGDLAAIVAQNALIPLNSLYNKSSLKGNLLPTLLSPTQAASPNGKTLYALPFSGVPATLWCNMNIFRKAHATCPTTWNGFFSTAKKLTNPSAGIYGFTMRGSSGATNQLIDEMVSYAGLKTFFNAKGTPTLDSPRALAFLQKFAGLYKTATPSADVDDAYLQMLAEFQSGKIGMMLHNLGSYATDAASVGGAKNLVGLTEPTSPYTSSNQYTMAAPGIDSYGIFKKSKYQAQDWKFEEFLLGPEANGYWNKLVGQIPGNAKVLQQKWVKQQQPIAQTLKILSQKGTTVVNEPLYLPEWGGIVTQMDPIWQEVLLGQVKPAGWLDKFLNLVEQAQSQWKGAHK